MGFLNSSLAWYPLHIQGPLHGKSGVQSLLRVLEGCFPCTDIFFAWLACQTPWSLSDFEV